MAMTILSHLLDYPSDALIRHRSELTEAAALLPVSNGLKQGLIDFIERRASGDLMDWQSEYEDLFDRGRSLSLLLFEHVHGESRDRGPAMVALLGQYREAGLEINERELPDYLPLYLEFLATQGPENCRAGLAEVAHVLAVLACRLEERDSDYAVLFRILLEMSGANIALDNVKQQLQGEKRDDTNEALDKVWEEEQVTFGPGAAQDSCSSGTQKPTESQRKDQYVPVSWVSADAVIPSDTQRGA